MQNNTTTQNKSKIASENALKVINNALEDAKALKVTVLDVAHLTAITDAMVICTGTSSRHMRHIAETALKAASEAGLNIISSEGLDSQDWIIVDVADVIVHVMSEQGREFYNLEGLWDMSALAE